MKRWDRRGLEGLPLKLLMISLLISLTAPAVLGSMETFERSTVRSQLQSEANRVANQVEELRVAGEGNRRAFTVTLPAALAKFSMSLEIGGDVGNVSSLTVRCSAGGRTFHTLVLDDPPARMTTPNGTALKLDAGTYRLAAECRHFDGRLAIVLMVMG